MNADPENRDAVDTVGEEEADERRIIGDAVARGFQAARWAAAVVGLPFIASGLWWAGVLVVVVTTFDLPRAAAHHYLRKRGVQLEIPSVHQHQLALSLAKGSPDRRRGPGHPLTSGTNLYQPCRVIVTSSAPRPLRTTLSISPATGMTIVAPIAS